MPSAQVVIQVDLQNDRHRAINDAAPTDRVPVSEQVSASTCRRRAWAQPRDFHPRVLRQVDSVILVQSAKVMHEPRCLARLHAAVELAIPIVPVVLVGRPRLESFRCSHQPQYWCLRNKRRMDGER